MEFLQTLENLYFKEPAAVTIGKFDGLHLGHRLLLEDIKKTGLHTVVIVVSTDAEGLMTSDERRKALGQEGIGTLVEISLKDDVAKLPPDVFLSEILTGKLNMGCLTVGPDFRFGYKAAGDVAFLESHAGSYELHVIPKKTYNGEPISSTRIRERLMAGDMTAVNDMLGTPYAFTGKVLHGQKIGRELGVPTVNIVPENGKLLPPFGVYVSEILLPDGTVEYGMANLGRKPTVGADNPVGLEMNIFWFEGNLYDSEVTIKLLDYLRPEAAFTDLKDLREQLLMDELMAKFYFKEHNR